MAIKSRIAKAKRRKRKFLESLYGGVVVKFMTRVHNRCGKCGRPRGYMRDFGICRICFREMADAGQIPGVRKSSW